ncbi:MAG: alpha/beta hydrolase [Microthrixaceae bacterium]|nr:alpha/beta hydrolase [Microthrixaceae bacterium]
MSGPPAPITEHRVDGLAVTRRRPDEPASSTVVLVHGAMDRAASFGRTMRRLGDIDVVAYDRRGYGGSLDPTAPQGEGGAIAQHARDLLTVGSWAAGPRNDRPVVFVGHSLGGLVGLVASNAIGPDQHNPPSAVGAFEAPLPWLEDDDHTSGAMTLQVDREQGPEAAAEFFYRSMVGDRTWERISERDRQQRRAEGPALVSELADARRPRGTAPDDDGIPIPRTGTQLFVARGGIGPVHLRRAAERLAAKGSVPCEVLEGAPHGAHLSHPDLFAAWVREVAGAPS